MEESEPARRGHPANVLFELLRRSIPAHVCCVNVYARLLPRLKGKTLPKVEVMASFHSDSLLAEVALDRAKHGDHMWGASFFRMIHWAQGIGGEPRPFNHGPWILADDFSNE